MTHSMPCAGSANKTTLAPLVVQQKKAIRIISKAKYRDHTAPLFSKLEILPLEQLILYNRLKFMHNYYFRKLPFSFHNLWLTNAERNPVHELRNVNDYFIPPHRIELRNANDYFIPPHRIELVKRMPLFSFPAAWNAETDEKFILSQPVYLKCLRKRLLLMFKLLCTSPFPPSPPSPLSVPLCTPLSIQESVLLSQEKT